MNYPFGGYPDMGADLFTAAMRNAVRDELRECLGLAPDRAGQLASPYEQGVSNSGAAVVTNADQSVSIITLKRPQMVNAGCEGLASVHVWVGDVGPQLAADETVNSRLQLLVSWQSGNGGGEDVLVDATRGSYFTVGGATALNVSAKFVTTKSGFATVPLIAKRVEVTVHWRTSINPVKAMITLPTIDTPEAGGPGAFMRIPQHAISMIALSPTPLLLPRLQADFAQSAVAGTIRYATLNPNANGTPIVHGVEFVRFDQLDDITMQVVPTFQLWI